MLLMGLERKAPIESRIPELWIGLNIFKHVDLAVEKTVAP